MSSSSAEHAVTRERVRSLEEPEQVVRRGEVELRELPDEVRQLAGTRDELVAYLDKLTVGTGGRVLRLDELDAFLAAPGREEATAEQTH